MNDLINITNENGQAVVSSREVAEHFCKEHRNVIQSIENISAENSAVTPMFFKTTYQAGTGKQYPMYLMNRDGFSLLAMGFTGKAALEWKLKYITAFNQMDEEINKPGNRTKIAADPATAAKRVAVMKLNASIRAAAQMQKIWSAAGVEPQYQVLAMQGYYPDLSLPREALKDTAVAMLDATTIAAHLGVLSKNGQPHKQAVGAIINNYIEVAPGEAAETPYCRNGHDGVSVQYTPSVESKVLAWLESHNWPTSIRSDGKNYAVQYAKNVNEKG